MSAQRLAASEQFRPLAGQAGRTAHLAELTRDERAVLMSWLGFSSTFALLRAITYSIRRGVGPFHNVSVGGAHLHHYMWGIGLLTGVGAVAVHGEDRQRKHPVVAGAYGVALALIVDEFALLLDLKDVYWAKEGRVSVDLGVGMVATVGTGLAATRLAQRLSRACRRTATNPLGGPSVRNGRLPAPRRAGCRR
jgi:hypothetical protein